MNAPELFTIEEGDFSIICYGAKAILIKPVDREQMWIPRSQIKECTPERLVMTAWIAKTKELI